MNKKRSLKQVIVEDIFESIYDPEQSFESFIEEKGGLGKPDNLHMIKIMMTFVKRISEIEKTLYTN